MSIKLKSVEMCGQRVLHINLDGVTDEEETTEDEGEMSDYKSDTEPNESKIKFKKCFDQKYFRSSRKKSDHFLEDNVSTYFDEDFGDNKLKKLNDRKVNRNDLKCKVVEEWSDQKPSTSKEEPINAMVGQSSGESVDLKPSTVQMRDQSTDTRYRFCPLNVISSIEDRLHKQNPVVPLVIDLPEIETETTPYTSTTISTVPKIWTYICLNCCERLESKKCFLNHFESIHCNTNLAKKYKKTDTSEQSEQNSRFVLISKPKHRHKSKSVVVSTHPSSHCSKDLSKSVNKRKVKQKSKPRQSVTNPCAPTSGQPSQLFINNNHYRVVQKCKICSFTPLIDSMKTIKKHIRKEHHQSDPHLYYSDTLVKIAPK